MVIYDNNTTNIYILTNLSLRNAAFNCFYRIENGKIPNWWWYLARLSAGTFFITSAITLTAVINSTYQLEVIFDFKSRNIRTWYPSIFSAVVAIILDLLNVLYSRILLRYHPTNNSAQKKTINLARMVSLPHKLQFLESYYYLFMVFLLIKRNHEQNLPYEGMKKPFFYILKILSIIYSVAFILASIITMIMLTRTLLLIATYFMAYITYFTGIIVVIIPAIYVIITYINTYVEKLAMLSEEIIGLRQQIELKCQTTWQNELPKDDSKQRNVNITYIYEPGKNLKPKVEVSPALSKQKDEIKKALVKIIEKEEYKKNILDGYYEIKFHYMIIDQGNRKDVTVKASEHNFKPYIEHLQDSDLKSLIDEIKNGLKTAIESNLSPIPVYYDRINEDGAFAVGIPENLYWHLLHYAFKYHPRWYAVVMKCIFTIATAIVLIMAEFAFINVGASDNFNFPLVHFSLSITIFLGLLKLLNHLPTIKERELEEYLIAHFVRYYQGYRLLYNRDNYQLSGPVNIPVHGNRDEHQSSTLDVPYTRQDKANISSNTGRDNLSQSSATKQAKNFTTNFAKNESVHDNFEQEVHEMQNIRSSGKV